MSTVGQINYETYCNCRNWKSFNGDPLPPWDDVDTEIKKAWETAALTVIQPYLKYDSKRVR